jgi:hypothetical protein
MAVSGFVADSNNGFWIHEEEVRVQGQDNLGRDKTDRAPVADLGLTIVSRSEFISNLAASVTESSNTSAVVVAHVSSKRGTNSFKLSSTVLSCRCCACALLNCAMSSFACRFDRSLNAG